MDNYLNLTSGIEYQDEYGQSNFCTSYACSQAIEALFRRVYGTVTPLSNTFLIGRAKLTDGRQDATGTSAESILNTAVEYGVAPLSLYPDSMDNDLTDNKFPEPSQQALEEAKKFRPTGWKELKTTEEICDAIEKWGSVVFEVRVFNEHLCPDNGFVNQPKTGSRSNGKHFIYVSGKSDMERFMNGRKEKNFFIMNESYSTSRGYRGRLYVPMRYKDEDIWVDYTNNNYIVGCYCFTYDGEMPYQTINAKNEVVIPRNIIELKMNDTRAIVNGNEVKMNTSACTINSRVFIGLRDVATLLDCAVRYDNSTKKVSIYSKQLQRNIYIYTNSNKAEIQDVFGNREYELVCKPEVVNGSTYLGIRDMGYIFDMDVKFDNKSKVVRLEGLL